MFQILNEGTTHFQILKNGISNLCGRIWADREPPPVTVTDLSDTRFNESSCVRLPQHSSISPHWWSSPY